MNICRELGKETKLTECRECYRFRTPDLEYVSRRALVNLKNEPAKAPKGRDDVAALLEGRRARLLGTVRKVLGGFAGTLYLHRGAAAA